MTLVTLSKVEGERARYKEEMMGNKLIEIVVLERFNQRDPGERFEASEADAKKWIAMGLAVDAKDHKKPPEEKGAKGPPKDKAVKEDEAVTK